MAQKNVDILLLVNTGTAELPTWTPVGSQRSVSYSEERDEIDLTSKDSGGATETGYGLFSWEIEADGVYVPEDEGFLALKNAIRNAELIKVQMKEGDAPTEEGDCLVLSREFESPYDGESTYNVSLKGTGMPAPATVTP
jgi:TP901-1 family phage major tail protein